MTAEQQAAYIKRWDAMTDRERDAEVAKTAMGWRFAPSNTHRNPAWKNPDGISEWCCPAFTTDPCAIEKVKEWLFEQGHIYSLTFRQTVPETAHVRVKCRIMGIEETTVFQPTEGCAVGLAAWLVAKGAK